MARVVELAQRIEIRCCCWFSAKNQVNCPVRILHPQGDDLPHTHTHTHQLFLKRDAFSPICGRFAVSLTRFMWINPHICEKGVSVYTRWTFAMWVLKLNSSFRDAPEAPRVNESGVRRRIVCARVFEKNASRQTQTYLFETRIENDARKCGTRLCWCGYNLNTLERRWQIVRVLEEAHPDLCLFCLSCQTIITVLKD